LGASFVRLARHWQLLSRQRDGSVLAVLFQRRRLLHYSGHLVRSFVNGRRSLVLRNVEGCEDLQLRMPTTDEQLAIDTSAHLTESRIVWASYTGARRKSAKPKIAKSCWV
jgi:hypothetical protein